MLALHDIYVKTIIDTDILSKKTQGTSYTSININIFTKLSTIKAVRVKLSVNFKLLSHKQKNVLIKILAFFMSW